MIVDNARGFIDALPNADVKAVQPRYQDRKRTYDQAAVRNQDFACYGCGSKEHLFKECPKRQAILQHYAQQYQNPRQQQPYVPKGPGKGVPMGQPLRKGDKGGKGKGKKGKDDAKNQSPKGKGKKQGRPGAKALEWDENNPEYPDDDYGYDEYPPEDQEQDQEPQGEAEEEEPYGYEWGGEDDQEEPEQSENNEMVKTIMTVMKKYAEEEAKEQKAKLSVS